MTAIVPIDDPADPRIEPYVQVRERDLAGRGGGLIAEGEVVVRVLAGPGSRARLRSLLIARPRLDRLSDLIGRLPADAPIYVATPSLMDRVVGFHIHRGVLAHAERPPEADAAALLGALPTRAIALVALGISNHDNMGGLFRNAAAFGAAALVLDARCCDPLYRKAIRVSVGAALTVPFARLLRAEDPLQTLDAAGFEALALTPSGGEPLADLRPPERAALLFGAEGPGLPAGVALRARKVSIPMAPGWDSLNVAAASAVALFALTSHGAGPDRLTPL